ncbi:hypothetical protein [Flavobacterium sp. 270]|uniref:hypothetical protein n=1 Tax=Flavobacterium sp. 270 TaxID=2512114 RepID=UPI001065C612|nr:hypothetical protein [Flavobacterium sp. 270]
MSKKILSFISVFLIISSIISCKDNKIEKKQIISIPQISNFDFDKILKINGHIYDSSNGGGFFTTSYDYGITYDPKKGNDFGNLETFLIPKDFLFFKKHSKYFTKDEYEKLQAYVNKLNIEELKKIFDIYVFLVDKKYLVETPSYDSPNKTKENYQTDLYQYKNNSWEKIESFKVDSEEKRLKETDWRTNSIDKKSKEIQTAFFNSISKLKIDDSWYRDYILLLDSYEPSYNYTYYIKVAKDSSYIAERPLKDLMVPYQDGDTLFLYHKKCLLQGSEYFENTQIPEVKIVKVKDKYYINSEVFDLKNSISNKSEKYGFLVSETY